MILARLMSAGYSVELAESERRAREILTHSRIALTILAGGHPGINLYGNPTNRILVTELAKARCRLPLQVLKACVTIAGAVRLRPGSAYL